MARLGRPCHASSARCAQNMRRHIFCRPNADRSSIKASREAGCPTGHHAAIALTVGTLNVAGMAVASPTQDRSSFGFRLQPELDQPRALANMLAAALVARLRRGKRA